MYCVERLAGRRNVDPKHLGGRLKTGPATVLVADPTPCTRLRSLCDVGVRSHVQTALAAQETPVHLVHDSFMVGPCNEGLGTRNSAAP
jgi:hypothetical protein